jgi:hypothetical protein
MKSVILATKSNRNQKEGTYMVTALLQTLEGHREDVDLSEFLRMVQNNVVNNNAPQDHQTPQVAIFPHKKLTFLKK